MKSFLPRLSVFALALPLAAACGSPIEAIDAVDEQTEAEQTEAEQTEAPAVELAFGQADEEALEQGILFGEAPKRTIIFNLGDGPQRLPVNVDHGWVYFQGDMLLGRVEDVQFVDEVAGIPAKGDRGAHGLAKAALMHLQAWPNGEIPFEIDSVAYPVGTAHGDAIRARIGAAVASVNSNSMIKLRAKGAWDLAFLKITSNPGDPNCNASLGYAAPPVPRVMHLDPACSTGSIIHEFGHAAGLFHEQGRTDRDGSIRVLTNNIVPEQRDQYAIYGMNGINGLDFGSFDFDSIMLYASFNSFSIDPPNLPTMNKRSCAANDFSAACVWTGQRAGFSTRDVAALARQVTGDPWVKFKIRNVQHNQCLRPRSSSTAEGATISVVACDGSARAQRWYTWRRPGMTRDVIVNENSRHCLARDAAGRLIQSRCTGGDSAKQFGFVGLGIFRGEQLQQSAGRCVSATATDATVSESCADTQSRDFTRDL